MTFKRRLTISGYRSSEEKTIMSWGGFTEEKEFQLGLGAKCGSETSGELPAGESFQEKRKWTVGLELGRKRMLTTEHLSISSVPQSHALSFIF